MNRASEGYREWLMDYMSPTACPDCQGQRLKPSSLAVRVKGFSIADFTAMPIARALPTCGAGSSPSANMQIVGRVVEEIRNRLEFLVGGRARLPEPGPFGRDAFRRRGAAHPAGDADRIEAARRAVCAGRAFDRAASARQRAAARYAARSCAIWAIRCWSSSTMRRRSSGPIM